MECISSFHHWNKQNALAQYSTFQSLSSIQSVSRSVLFQGSRHLVAHQLCGEPGGSEVSSSVLWAGGCAEPATSSHDQRWGSISWDGTQWTQRWRIVLACVTIQWIPYLFIYSFFIIILYLIMLMFTTVRFKNQEKANQSRQESALWSVCCSCLCPSAETQEHSSPCKKIVGMRGNQNATVLMRNRWEYRSNPNLACERTSIFTSQMKFY